MNHELEENSSFALRGPVCDYGRCRGTFGGYGGPRRGTYFGAARAGAGSAAFDAFNFEAVRFPKPAGV